jgi:hypothetical protein
LVIVYLAHRAGGGRRRKSVRRAGGGDGTVGRGRDGDGEDGSLCSRCRCGVPTPEKKGAGLRGMDREVVDGRRRSFVGVARCCGSTPAADMQVGCSAGGGGGGTPTPEKKGMSQPY